MRNEILEYFRKANGNYVSGEQISRDLNVSRTAIWKHINILKHTERISADLCAEFTDTFGNCQCSPYGNAWKESGLF